MRASVPATLRHAVAVVAGYTLLFTWLFFTPILHGAYMAEADLYDWFLPIFLSPISTWSHDMFAGLPLFADTSDSQAYLFHFLFAHILHSWTGYIISAYVLGSACTYAYVFTLTRSKMAAALSGVAFGLSHTMLERQAQINIVHCTAWFPLMVLAVDRVLSADRSAEGGRRWIAIGAFATANCFLAGHPQSILYAVSFCALYAVVGAVAERASPAFYARAGGMLLLAIALTAVKSLPFVEMSRYMARSQVTYQWFIDPAPSIGQIVRGLLNPPLHDPSKPVSLYVGLAVLGLAVVGATSRRFTWRARVWAAAAVGALLLVAGDATPVAWLVFHLPLWNKFRLISRILFIFSCATAVLAGFALADLQRRSRRPQRFVAFAVALIVLVGTDLLYHVQYPVGAGGLQVTTIDAAATRPSVHATALAAAVAPTHQRLLAVGGSSRDATIPSGFSRLWRIPIAGGYSPIMTARLAALAMMGSPGDVYPDVLAGEDRSLDLLAVRDIIVRDDDYSAPQTFDAEGLTWATPPLDFSVGRSDCGPPYERSVSFQLPADTAVVALGLVAHLRCAEEVPQGTAIARINVSTPDTDYQRPLIAGVDIADQGLQDQQARARASHRIAKLFVPRSNAPYTYVTRVDLPAPARGAKLTMHVAPMRGWLTIDRLTLVDDRGHSLPQTLGPLLLSNTDRWRKASQYRTSRTSDRLRDDAGPGEQGYTVYENLRALPRIWIVPEAVALPEQQAIETIRYSQLPDGRAFDPTRITIVDPGGGAPSFPPGPADAHLTSIEDTRMTADISTANGGYVVLSEAQLPGWRARIDGARAAAPLQRVDVMFQGVVVPPGRHTVVFELASTTLRAGVAISMLALIVALFMLGNPATVSGSRDRTAAGPDVQRARA